DPATAGGIGGAHRQFQTTVLYLWEMAFFRRDFGEAAAIAWLLFIIILGIGLINFWLTQRIATAENRAVKGRAARKTAAKLRRMRAEQQLSTETAAATVIDREQLAPAKTSTKNEDVTL